MSAANNNRLHEVQTDVYIARRKRFHAVYDPKGDLVYSTPHIVDVLAWLVANDLHTAIFTDNDDTYTVTFVSRPLHVKPEQETDHG